jgi:hypothetical protein
MDLTGLPLMTIGFTSMSSDDKVVKLLIPKSIPRY